MGQYTDTNLWKRAFIEVAEHKGQAETLMNSYQSIRCKAVALAGEIAKDLPEYTVHDISHIDALWEAADMILPKDFVTNPAEAYVLGVSFLVHDLGMGLAAYSSKDEIKNYGIWKDVAASEYKKKYKTDIHEDSWSNLDEDIVRKSNEVTLRKLHAERAKELPCMKWEFDGQESYLIEDAELRTSYGSIIGQIAYSHWWSIDRVKNEFGGVKLGALSSSPREWTVDALKLACVIRIADAMQIDDRRAPLFLMLLRKPDNVSKFHWVFQNKLYQPQIRNGKLLYTSKSAFELEDREAWWACYDTLQMIDSELKSVDDVLKENGYEQLNATGVIGVLNATELSKYITIHNWIPVETSIRVGDVSRLVSTLGGAQLYGKNLKVPFRELVQNGSDAVRARKILEDDDYVGNITISITDIGDSKMIEIEDDGVGMSKNVLLGSFLNFGHSFWNTEQMYDEFPGLAAKGFSSTGKYGIGFYSVFMWSEEVTVITRRYDAGRDQTLVLEFNHGTNGRPILRMASREEQIKEGGTKIKVILDKKVWNAIIKEKEREDTADEIAKECPCMDCNVWLRINGTEKQSVIKAKDWLTISSRDFVKRIIGPKRYNRWDSASREFVDGMLDNMRIIEKDGQVYGRAMICGNPFSLKADWKGKLIVGGFSSSDMYGILGVMLGESTRASREAGCPYASNDILQEWLQEQIELIKEKDIPTKHQIDFSYAISRYWSKPERLPFCIAYNHEKELYYEDIVALAADEKYDSFIIPDEVMICALDDEDFFPGIKYTLNDNVLITAQDTLHAIPNIKWPCDEEKLGLSSFVLDIIMDTWGITEDERKHHVRRWNAQTEGWKEEIGTVGGQKWMIAEVIKVSRSKLS